MVSPETAQPLSRSTLRHDVSDRVRAMILDGELEEGARVNEVHLAVRLGVSRTPVREALNLLAGDGELTSRPGHGYEVKPLTFAEAQPLYQMRPILDPAALRLAGLPAGDRMARLRELNDRLKREDDPLRCLDIDDCWHLELVGHCPNPILLDLVRHFMRRTRRYELALMRERGEVEAAAEQHDAILAALEVDDLDGACEALRQNLLRGAEPLARWLRTREKRREGA